MITTKYAQTRNKILEYIARKDIQKGDALPTEKKMAELFDVSIITIRKAVSSLETEKIVRREQGRGTFLQMDLTNRMPKNGELLYLDILRDTCRKNWMPIFFPWLKAMELRLKQYGWSFSTLVTSDRPDAAVLKRMRNVKGIIATNHLSEEWIRTLRSLNIPTVIMGAIDVPPEGIPVVTHDYAKMTVMLAQKLLEQGGRNFALFPGGQDYVPAKQMFQALSAFLAEKGIAFSEESVCYSNENGNAIQETKDFFEAHPGVDACLVESGAFVPMMASLFDSQRRPVTGILSIVPRFRNFSPHIHECVFEENIADKSLEVLLRLINGGTIPGDLTIAPTFSLDVKETSISGF